MFIIIEDNLPVSKEPWSGAIVGTSRWNLPVVQRASWQGHGLSFEKSQSMIIFPKGHTSEFFPNNFSTVDTAFTCMSLWVHSHWNHHTDILYEVSCRFCCLFTGLYTLLIDLGGYLTYSRSSSGLKLPFCSSMLSYGVLNSMSHFLCMCNFLLLPWDKGVILTT